MNAPTEAVTGLYTTRRYPCGCRAEGPGDVPNYCHEHDARRTLVNGLCYRCVLKKATREVGTGPMSRWLCDECWAIEQRSSNERCNICNSGSFCVHDSPYALIGEIERRCDEIASLQQKVASLTRTLEAAREASGNIAASNLRLRDETERLKLERKAFVAALAS